MWKEERKEIRLIYIVSVILFLVSILRGCLISQEQIHVKPAQPEKSISILSEMNEDWILISDDGTSETVSLPLELDQHSSQVTIKRNVDGVFRNGDIIKFSNMRQGMRVLLDGTLVYEVNTTSLNRQVVFTDDQLIPVTENTKEITIQIVYSTGEQVIFPEIYYGEYRVARYEIIRSEIWTIILLSILGVFLLFSGFILVFCRFKRIRNDQILDLSIFILTAMLWGYTDSYLPVLTQIPQEVLGLICYLTIMALPLPLCHFLWISGKKQYQLLRWIAVIGSVNMISQVVLSILGLVQLQRTFYSAHVLIIAAIFGAFITIHQIRREMHSLEMNILYIGVISLGLIAGVSLVMYWQRGGLYYRNCMLVGVIIFSVMLFLSAIIHYLKRMQEDEQKLAENRIYERLSLYDELTGLPNRRAFEKQLSNIEKEADVLKDAVLIMLDLNGLKIINDQYGHNAGDDLLIAAARVLEETYGKEGACYRIGGDEFGVILQDLSVPLSDYQSRFVDGIFQINTTSSWKLSMASGYSHLIQDNGQRLSISDWKQEADINMYRNKVSMTHGKNREQEKDFQEIINCVIATVEAKDEDTAAHSNRVKDLAVCIAQKLGISDFTINDLEVAAQFHDIGKIGIPDAILQKPDRLTSEEYKAIKKHVEIGANIIGQAKGMQDIANIVLHHHEKWDGTGYPDGLAREEIPMESRIIALADSIDAITSRRIYKDSISVDVCREEIERNAGIMFDPAISQIVLQNWDDIVELISKNQKKQITDNQ